MPTRDEIKQWKVQFNYRKASKKGNEKCLNCKSFFRGKNSLRCKKSNYIAGGNYTCDLYSDLNR